MDRGDEVAAKQARQSQNAVDQIFTGKRRNHQRTVH